jgi:spore coat polysaccharide biosynthesis protein SpsF
MSRKVVAIVQARMGSSRLPGKVLSAIGGRAMLGCVVQRTALAASVAEIVVATTTEPADDALEAYCKRTGLNWIRGSQFDVLDRYYKAACGTRAEIVVRITGDCPLIDPGLIDEVVRTLAGNSEGDSAGPSAGSTPFDFTANRLPPPWQRTYPIGLDAEACTFRALERAWAEAREPQQREHVMPYLYENVTLSPAGPGLSAGSSPRGFHIAVLHCGADYGSYRWTVDTSEDLDFVRRVYGHFGNQIAFSWRDVLDLVHRHPELTEINASVKHKTLRDVDERAPGA